MVCLAPEFEGSGKSTTLLPSDAVVAFEDTVPNLDAEDVAGLAVGTSERIGLDRGTMVKTIEKNEMKNKHTA